VRRSRVPDMSRRCPACLFRPEDCLCGEIPRIAPPVEFLLLRHASEVGRSTNSGRWAALALGAPIVEYGGDGGRPLDQAPLRQPGTWVLFPSARITPRPAPRPDRLVVLDASWSQARRMLQRVPALRHLPRLSLPAPPVRERLRAPTVAGGMSTLEAMARALEWLGAAEQRRLRGQRLRTG
jgi:DTW domain-containing protein